jgi:phosphatidylserine decarboxylase
MRIDAAAWPFIGGSLILAALAGWLSGLWAAAPFLALSAVFAFFFRDPERVVPQDPGLVLSPADGRVMVAGEPDGRLGPPGRWQQITIFLSPMDVHVNRMPVDGRVAKVEYHPGRFLPAYRADAGDLNEHTQVTIERNGYNVVVRQIVGVLARRIVCRVKPGDSVRAGDRFGVMKFGSRMDVFLPAHAVVAVTVGDRVVGGVTVLARLDR